MHTLRTWNSSSKNAWFKHNFTRPDVKGLSLAFLQTVRPSTIPSTNTFRLHELTLNNTASGGASECTECLLGGSEKG